MLLTLKIIDHLDIEILEINFKKSLLIFLIHLASLRLETKGFSQI